MKREEAKQLIERGVRELNEALAAGKSDRLRKYLDVMARFPSYSFNNQILICLQAPEASRVQGFHAWRKMGRTVIKGQKGIGIIAPMIGKKDDPASADDGKKRIFGFKVVHVFDVSQTEGDDLPEVANVAGDPGSYIPAVEGLLESWNIELLYEQIESGADGVSKKGTIVISPDLEPAKQLLTLIHETAHELLHADKKRREETTKTIRETEAEAVAYVVASALGIDCVDHSSDYIQLYSGDAEVLASSMEAIQKSSARILAGVQEYAASSPEAEVAYGS